MANKTKIVDMFRNAKTGEFVTEQYANRHKATTEHERRRVIVPQPTKKGK